MQDKLGNKAAPIPAEPVTPVKSGAGGSPRHTGQIRLRPLEKMTFFEIDLVTPAT